MKSHKTIFVNPVPRQSVQGRDKQTYNVLTGNSLSKSQMNKTKEFGVGSEYSFLIDFNRNKLVTGLDQTISNPFFEVDSNVIKTTYNLSSNWTKERLEEISSSEDLKKQTYFEILDDVVEGFYTSEVGDNMFKTRNLDTAKPSSFLEQFKIILYDRPNPFKDDTPRGRLAIQLIQNSPLIAKDRNSYNSAYHHFYISEENESERETKKKQQLIKTATYHLHKLEIETPEYIEKIARIMKFKDGRPIVKGNVKPLVLNNTLSNFILSNSPQRAYNMNQFIKAVKLLDSVDGIKSLDVKYLIQRAINTNIIGVRDGYYIWHSQISDPNVYKFKDKNKLFSFLFKEFETYNEESDHTNWYGILLNELKPKI